MKAFVINGAEQHDNDLDRIYQVLLEELESLGYQVQSFFSKDTPLAHCIGCFGCWTKTPGVCAIGDIGNTLQPDVVDSELLVCLSPVTFGGYSALAKKAWERFVLPLLYPDIIEYQGDSHHPPRYPQRRKLLGIGVSTETDQEREGIFHTLVRRNAINLATVIHSSGIIYRGQSTVEISTKIKRLCAELEGCTNE